MPNKASIFFRLGNGDPAVARERLEMIEAQVQKTDLAGGVAFVKREFDLDTSENALCRELKKLRAEKNFEATLDKLERRRNRRKGLGKIVEENGPVVSPENIQLIDETINDLLAALDAITGEDEKSQALRAKIEERLERYTKNLATLAKAADSQTNTRVNVEKIRLLQFDAARAALAKSAELAAIRADTSLDDTERTNAARQLLFGEVAP